MTPAAGYSIIVVAVSTYAILRPSFIGFIVAAAANAAAAWLYWQTLQ